ncbi:MAG TPA: phosphatase PAP2 family protein [Chloroflexia bacterium]|nr:phosphatase PAP2 family protein [Chloroflexia bacterium]
MEDPTLNPNPQAAIPNPRPFWHPGTFIALVRGRLLLVAIVLLSVLFVLLTALILRADLKPTAWDVGITHEMQEFPRFPVGEVLVWISWPGFRDPIYQNWLIPAAIAAFMVWRRWLTEAVFTVVAALGGFTADIVKNIIDRPRPPADLAVRVLDTYSFPSGHVTGYVVLYGFVFYLAFTLLLRRFLLRWLVLVICGIMIALVGPSRVYMGQHWASDVLAGYALGFMYLLAVIEFYRFWIRRHPKAPVTQPPMMDDGRQTTDDGWQKAEGSKQ